MADKNTELGTAREKFTTSAGKGLPLCAMCSRYDPAAHEGKDDLVCKSLEYPCHPAHRELGKRTNQRGFRSRFIFSIINDGDS